MINAIIIATAVLLGGYLAFSKTVVAWQDKGIPKRALRIGSFVFLAIMCFLVFALGLPSE